jgi:hypothetical protein
MHLNPLYLGEGAQGAQQYRGKGRRYYNDLFCFHGPSLNVGIIRVFTVYPTYLVLK